MTPSEINAANDAFAASAPDAPPETTQQGAGLAGAAELISAIGGALGQIPWTQLGNKPAASPSTPEQGGDTAPDGAGSNLWNAEIAGGVTVGQVVTGALIGVAAAEALRRVGGAVGAVTGSSPSRSQDRNGKRKKGK